MTRRFLFIVMAAASVLVLQGCEDDPILQPQQGKVKGGGSYSKINFDSTHGRPTPVNAAADRADNPEIF